MPWLVLVIAVVLGSFGGVLLRGAPYLPTLTGQIDTALDLAGIRPGDTLLELGSGDGKVLVAAARRGLKVVGYELNPLLVVLSWLRTRRYRGQVKIVWGDFWHQDWPPAEGIFTFLLPKYMRKLDKKVMQYKYQPVNLVSFAFPIPDRKPAAKRGSVFLYRYK